MKDSVSTLHVHCTHLWKEGNARHGKHRTQNSHFTSAKTSVQCVGYEEIRKPGAAPDRFHPKINIRSDYTKLLLLLKGQKEEGRCPEKCQASRQVLTKRGTPTKRN
jgi:hypothetical protein